MQCHWLDLSSGSITFIEPRCSNFQQVPETAKEVSDHLNEAARTVGERAVPAADDVSANIMGHAKNFEKQLPAAAEVQIVLNCPTAVSPWHWHS